MKRVKPEIELRELIEIIAEGVAAPSIELADVAGISPTVLHIKGTPIRYDIKKLSGAEYAAGDKVAVELVDGDYIILGKVVDAG